jgi:HD domain
MENNSTAAAKVLGFLPLAERLKRELRHSWLSDGRSESVAEHTWFMALMALLTHRRLEEPVSLERVLAMAIVHDLAEIEVGDIPYFETGDRKAKKAELELAAIGRIATMLPVPEGDMVKQLWLEFEEGNTPEAGSSGPSIISKSRFNITWRTFRPGSRSSTGWSIRKWTSDAPTTRSCGNFWSESGQPRRPRCARGGVDVDAVRDRIGV